MFPLRRFAGQEASVSEGESKNIVFSERFFYESLERNYTAVIYGLDPGVPGAFGGLHFEENGYVELPDMPFGVPSISVSESCFECVTAFGSVVPEPKSWAMMLAGFGLLGYTVRRQRRRVSMPE